MAITAAVVGKQDTAMVVEKQDRVQGCVSRRALRWTRCCVQGVAFNHVRTSGAWGFVVLCRFCDLGCWAPGDPGRRMCGSADAILETGLARARPDSCQLVKPEEWVPVSVWLRRVLWHAVVGCECIRDPCPVALRD